MGEKIWAEIQGYHNFSYKYYSRLPQKDKEFLESKDLYPNELLFILHLVKYGLSIEKAYKKLNRDKLEEYWEYTSQGENLEGRRDPNIISQRSLKRELEFRGFIPLSSFKKYSNKYDYIMTNRYIDGEYWIYPKRFSSSYNLISKGVKEIHKHFPLICLPGFSRINYSKL